jgi:hypothetical protein
MLVEIRLTVEKIFGTILAWKIAWSVPAWIEILQKVDVLSFFHLSFWIDRHAADTNQLNG